MYLRVLMPHLFVLDCGIHCPVQTFQLNKAEDDPGLCCGGQNILFGHTENSVKDVDFDIWSQRRQRLEKLEQLLFAASGHVRDK